MQLESPSPPRLNCVRMTKADTTTLINALMDVRRELLAEGMTVVIRPKPLLKSNSTVPEDLLRFRTYKKP